MASAKIVIGTLLWKRHAVFRVWAQALLDAATGPFEVVVVGSEGDKSRAVVEEYGFRYVETHNRPLGAKANLRLAACSSLDPDYVVLCGSDDIVSPKTFAYYRERAEEGIDEVTIADIYYFHAHTGELVYCCGYTDHRKGQPLAPWRMLSRRLCEALDWHAWDASERVFLDGHSFQKLEAIPHSSHRIHLREQGLFVCDIKSRVNMTPWRMRDNWSPDDPQIIGEHLSPPVAAALRDLSQTFGDEETELGVDHLRPRGQRRGTAPPPIIETRSRRNRRGR